MQDVCNGMSYLHNEGVIHRDLAARNLLVSRADHQYVIKITDFGMSKALESEHYYAQNTKVIPVLFKYQKLMIRSVGQP